jgi:hypothetical protein
MNFILLLSLVQKAVLLHKVSGNMYSNVEYTYFRNAFFTISYKLADLDVHLLQIDTYGRKANHTISITFHKVTNCLPLYFIKYSPYRDAVETKAVHLNVVSIINKNCFSRDESSFTNLMNLIWPSYKAGFILDRCEPKLNFTDNFQCRHLIRNFVYICL